MPLLFEPGTEWNYSVATDVLGRLVEVVSGQSLDDFLPERIFEPLGMTDTGFSVGETEPRPPRRVLRRRPGAHGGAARRHGRRAALQPPAVLSGGGGLVSTAADYHRFTQMLLRPRRARRRAAAVGRGRSAT